MLNLHIVLVVIGLAMFSNPLSAQTNLCGSPPAVEDVSLKGEIDGKAQSLSRYANDQNLKGPYEIATRDVLSKYPSADKLRINQYFLYVICITIASDTGLSTIEKVNQIRRSRDDIFPQPAPISSIRIESSGMWVGNSAIGDVRAGSSKIEFYVDGEYQSEMRLSDAFDGFEVDLKHGPHTLTYKVDVRSVNGLRVVGSCSAVFNVRGRQIFNPGITFEPYDYSRGTISRCFLRSASESRG